MGNYLTSHVLPHLHMTAEEAASAMSVSRDFFADVLSDGQSLDQDLAEKLHRLSGLSVGFWFNMEEAAHRKGR